MSSFGQFTRLPLKLQWMIWEVASQDTEPGICISKESAEGVLLRVFYKLPTVFHACRDSRAVARRYVRHFELDDGACFGAHRCYQPDRDILYLSLQNFMNFPDEFPPIWHQGAKARHLAMGTPEEYDHSLFQWEAFRERLEELPNLRKVTMVTEGDGSCLSRLGFWYRLEDINDDETVRSMSLMAESLRRHTVVEKTDDLKKLQLDLGGGKLLIEMDEKDLVEYGTGFDVEELYAKQISGQ
ncbi:hypothetical protein F5B20DRAFT_363577 [Whalleya microplaca]|nr:hypothetical protein F5B20DRAFT_363577 [Whalleya microplaca]